MSKKISKIQIEALKSIINDNMEGEKTHLANVLRDCGEHYPAEEVEHNLTTDERIAEICIELGETDSTWYQYFLLLPLI